MKELNNLRKCMIENNITFVRTANEKGTLCISIVNKDTGEFTDLLFEEEINADMILYKHYKTAGVK